jgi:hypothetical protein
MDLLVAWRRNVVALFLAVAVTASLIVVSQVLTAVPEGDQQPSIIDGRFGRVDTSAYDLYPITSLREHPRIDVPVDNRYADTYSFLAIESVDQLASLSRLIVRGRVASFSKPYFNSLDGSFWHPYLVDAKAGRAVADEILMDVDFKVDEVLAGELPAGAKGDTITFAVRGGQAVVTIGDAIADPHVLPAGTHVVAYRPDVDLKVGEEAVLFLNRVPLDGLYADGGTAYGYRYTWMPAHDLYYKFTPANGAFRSSAFLEETAVTAADLRVFAGTSAFGSAAGPLGDDLVHDQEPAHGGAAP